MTWGVSHAGVAAQRRARAAAVADLTALAAVTGGDTAASTVAAANAASVRSLTRTGATVTAVVVLDGITDVSAARPG